METTKEEKSVGVRLVIFGCGYVGTAFAQRALAKGWDVSALTRNLEQAEALSRLGLRNVVTAELQGNDWHDKLKGDYDYCLNCVSSAGGGLEGYRLSYLEGMQSIRNWAKQRRVGALVYTSSTSVYSQTGGQWVDEACTNDGATDSAKVLLDAEKVVLQEPRPWERAFVLRLSGIYGPGRHLLLDQIKAGEKRFAGTGDHFLNLIHRDDIISAIEYVFEQHNDRENGIYNLSDGCPYTKSEVVEWLAVQSGMSAPDFSGELGDGPRARLFRQGPMPSRRISNRKFCDAFGWQPRYTDFKKGYEGILANMK